MDSFISLLCFMGSRTDDDVPKFDILASLPPEMAVKILRMLDPASLLSCALVNKSWLSYVKSHPEMRSRVRRHLRRLRRERAEPLNVRIRALRGGQGRLFGASNECYEMRTMGSKRAASPVRKHKPVIIAKGGQSLMKMTMRKAKKVTLSAVGNVLGLPAGAISSSSSQSCGRACKVGRSGNAAQRILRV